jgi:hypothetical protein
MAIDLNLQFLNHVRHPTFTVTANNWPAIDQPEAVHSSPERFVQRLAATRTDWMIPTSSQRTAAITGHVPRRIGQHRGQIRFRFVGTVVVGFGHGLGWLWFRLLVEKQFRPHNPNLIRRVNADRDAIAVNAVHFDQCDRDAVVDERE